jgi:hypothetical protein
MLSSNKAPITGSSVDAGQRRVGDDSRRIRSSMRGLKFRKEK